MFDESILKEILVRHSFGVCSSDIVILESGYCDPDHIWIRYRNGVDCLGFYPYKEYQEMNRDKNLSDLGI